MKIKKIIVGPVRTNCYIISSGNEMAVIDPGGDSEVLFKELEKMPQKLKYIINTHFHFDHSISNLDIQKRFSGKVLVHEKEKKYINYPVDEYLKSGQKLKIGNEELEIINTPGHTKGSICLLGPNHIFTGDTLFKNAHGRTDLPGGSEQEMEKSLEKLSKIIKSGMTVYPGHGKEYMS